MGLNIVLDLDGTLIHALAGRNVLCRRSFHNKLYLQNFRFCMKEANTNHIFHTYFVYKRPNLRKFIDFLFEKCDSVSVWTAGTKLYAMNVIKNIFKRDEIHKLKFIYTRQHTKKVNDLSYIKVLTDIFQKYKSLNSNNTLLLDDNLNHNIAPGSEKYLLNIKQYDGNSSDKELNKIMNLINRYKKPTDIIKAYAKK